MVKPDEHPITDEQARLLAEIATHISERFSENEIPPRLGFGLITCLAAVFIGRSVRVSSMPEKNRKEACKRLSQQFREQLRDALSDDSGETRH